MLWLSHGLRRWSCVWQALEAKEKKKGLELLRKLARKLQDKRVKVCQILARGDPALELVQVCVCVCVRERERERARARASERE